MSATELLNQADFLRLIRGAAFMVTGKRLGLPSPLLPLEKLAEENLAECGFFGHWPEIQKLLAGFLALPEFREPYLTESAAHYAGALQEAWQKNSRTIIFSTSGSTGQPKASPHSAALLEQEAQETGGLFQGVQRILVTVPLLHSYGFIFGLMLPKTLAVPVLDIAPFPTVLAENLRPGDLAVAFPLLLSRLESLAAPDVQFLTSTAPCPDELFQATVDKGFRLTEIYGASETGAVAVRYVPGPFQLLGHWRRLDAETLARLEPGGPEHTYPLPDNITWHGEHRFVPAGRRDQAVQVAGVNVYPARVARVLLEHPNVKECVVRLMSPGEGFRLKAFIVPAGEFLESTVFRRELQKFMKARLSPAERPAHLSFGPELPRSLAGKDADWAI